MRYSVVIRYIGIVLLVLAAFMLVSAGISYASNVDSAYTPLVMSSLLTLVLGCFPLIFVPRSDRISQKEGYCIVVGSWVVASIVGMFPYLMWGGEFTFINTSGSSALAKAGSGDVLAGMLASVVASGVEPLSAAALSVYFHGLGADVLADELSEFGVTPSDLPREIARQIRRAL